MRQTPIEGERDMTNATTPTGDNEHQPSRVRRVVAGITVALLTVSGAILGATPANAEDLSLGGYLRDPVTNVGIEHIRVAITTDDGGGHTLAEFTDSAGHYQFGALPADGLYTLRVNDANPVEVKYATMYYPDTPFRDEAYKFNLTSTTNQVFSLDLTYSGSMSGAVTFDGAPTPIYPNLIRYNASAHSWQGVTAGYTSGTAPWTVEGLLPGIYKVFYLESGGSPLYSLEYFNDARKLEDADLITVVGGATTENINAHLTVEGPSNVVRLAGQDRFATSARIAQEYSEADTVFVANGLGYPDALSAAPAAAFLDAPLLLTTKDTIPAVVRAEIERLDPSVIYVVGGTGVVSPAVFSELESLATLVLRLSGPDRYSTSQAVFAEVWTGESAPNVFLADGRNFPDALSSASAAAHSNGPVVLVNGGSSTLPAGLDTRLQSANTTDVWIAGGPAVVSTGIETDANNVPGVNSHRLFGSDRYTTSVAVNDEFFPGKTQPVFLAVGTGYADALAGAALAGAQIGPLYLVPGNCVPQDVLDKITDLSTSRIVVLGGTGVLTAAVEALTSCTPTS
jgi:putative cell wall-binding protein